MRIGALRFILLFAVLLAGCRSGDAEGGDPKVSNTNPETDSEVRAPVVAGAFYSGDAGELARDVDRYLAAAERPELAGEVVAVISPHAGYVYSGGVAAPGYEAVEGRRFDTVIVVAPSHRLAFRGASIYGGDGYATPLGTVPVDSDLAAAVRGKSSSIGYEPGAHAAEHSLEVQVPFLQRTLGEFSIVPIIMGDQSIGSARILAAAIASAVEGAEGKRVLLVASTDLSHYHDDDTARRLDARVVRAVEDFDPEGLLESLARGECEACGGGPMATVMMAARELGADRARVVKYATSGDTSGDKSQVVGYLAAVITRPGSSGGGTDDAGEAGSEAGAAGETPAPYRGLTLEEKGELLTLARGTIESAVGGGNAPRSTLESEALDTACGAFVTLNERGRLRGCIGHVRGDVPLRQTVAEMAVQAALHDPRFPSVTKEEVESLEIEISVLSPLTEVKDVSEIVVGRDGLIIQEGARSGLLLPQVATEYGWDRETFLEHTCRKAGLPEGCWRREGVVILRFSAEVFNEREVLGER